MGVVFLSTIYLPVRPSVIFFGLHWILALFFPCQRFGQFGRVLLIRTQKRLESSWGCKNPCRGS
ncbi:hypothetical protein L218DRAFT_248912 [Marasmius fiardii PR-910]|nr:hypothetical protein L218DRAFT_248912 [Marasmius fiardii PR-910]